MTDCACNHFPATLGNVTFDGSVGVGTTAPNTRLAVGAGNALAVLAFTGAQPTGFSTYGTAIAAFDDGSSPTKAAALLAGQDTGNFGGLRWNVAATPASASLDAGTFSAQKLNLVTGGAARVTLDTAGNVGVGTQSPAYPLDVNGVAHVSGVLLVGQDVTLNGAINRSTGGKLVDQGGCYYAS